MRPRRQPAWVRARRFFNRGNVIRAVVSLVLAFILWGWVTAENNPQERRFFGGVQVTTTKSSSKFQITSSLPTVDLLLEGPRSELNRLDLLTIQATVDLSSVKQAGTVTLPVHVDTPDQLRVRQVIPAQVSVTIQEAARQATPTATQAP